MRKPRGRPRKDGLPPIQRIPPEQYKNNLPKKAEVLDARYFADLLAEVRKHHTTAIRKGKGGVKSYEKTVQGILAEASLRGIKPESVLDNRDIIDKALAFVDRLEELEEPLSGFDEEFNALVKAFDLSDGLCVSYLQTEQAKEDDKYRKIERLRKKAERLGKVWRDRIAKIMLLRERVRTPVPPNTPYTMIPLVKEGTAAGQVLRHMLYVMRSNLSDRQAMGGAKALIDIQYHHAKMAVEHWMARNHRVPRAGMEELWERVPGDRLEGEIIVLPPGSGKTTFALGAISQEINQNHNLKVLIGHAQEDQAKTNLIYLSKFYDPKDAMGRRNIALYNVPELQTVSATRFRLKTKATSRQPTARAHGMTARISGSDADFIWFDDPVDVSEREQPEERRRKSQVMTGTWMARLRGTKTFHLTTTTLWHEDDANMRRIKMARAGKLMIQVTIMRCGGPETHPKFKSIWPEVLPPSKLKQMWLQDPAMYAAAYMANPLPEESQIIRKIRFYDPKSDTHAGFLKAATCYLSVDPAATARAKSNRAGVLYAALNNVTDGKVTEKRLRILTADRLLATQSQIIEHIAGFSFSNRVDFCIVEMVNAFLGIGEQLANQFGIEAIPVHPGLRSKEIRLRGVAPLLEDSRPSTESSGAVVEFPGMRMEDGTVGPDPYYQWFYDQVLRFGVQGSDDALDALTQMVAYLQRTGELNAGSGFVTEAVQRTVATGDNRIKRLLDQYAGREKPNNVEQEDADFAAQMTWN